jgi:hypothetical protein
MKEQDTSTTEWFKVFDVENEKVLVTTDSVMFPNGERKYYLNIDTCIKGVRHSFTEQCYSEEELNTKYNDVRYEHATEFVSVCTFKNIFRR